MSLLGRDHADELAAPRPRGATPCSRSPAARSAPRRLTVHPLAAIAAIVVCLMLAACGGHTAQPSTSANRPQSRTPPAQASPALIPALPARQRKSAIPGHSGSPRAQPGSAAAKAGRGHATKTGRAQSTDSATSASNSSKPGSDGSKPLLRTGSHASSRAKPAPTATGLLTPSTTTSVPSSPTSSRDHSAGESQSPPIIP